MTISVKYKLEDFPYIVDISFRRNTRRACVDWIRGLPGSGTFIDDIETPFGFVAGGRAAFLFQIATEGALIDPRRADIFREGFRCAFKYATDAVEFKLRFG